MPSYEPEVIERFASQLERRARAVRRGFTIGGVALGALFGSIPLTSLGRAWPIPHVFGFTTLLAGIIVGALIGWVVGEGRAAMYRLHAQTTLCQLHAQRTTLAIWRLLQDRPADSAVPVAEDLEPVAEVDVEPEPEPEPVLPPAARLAEAPPLPLRPLERPFEPVSVPLEPVAIVPPPVREFPVPVSASAYREKRAEPAPRGVHAAAPQPPVSPPPLSS
jgi:hypothetical protein